MQRVKIKNTENPATQGEAQVTHKIRHIDRKFAKQGMCLHPGFILFGSEHNPVENKNNCQYQRQIDEPGQRKRI